MNTPIRAAITLIAGALLPLSLAPWFWWPVGLASVATLAILLRGATARQAYWRTFLFSFAMFAAGASWVFVSMNTYGNTSVFLSTLLTAVFVAMLALVFALPFLLFGLFRNHNRITLLLGFPAVWVLAEWSISWILTGFPWIYLGYGHLNSWLSGWAPVVGVWGVSWIVALCGAIIALYVSGKKWFDATRLTAVATALLLWIGGYALQSVTWTEPQKPLKVGLLQPDIPVLEKWNREYVDGIISKNLKLSQALWSSDLVIWPEAAIPVYKHQATPLLRQLDLKARQHDSTFISGIQTQELDGKYYNTVMAIGQGNGEYRKQHLVIIGEYVPMAKYIRGLTDFFDLPMSGFTPGTADQPPLTAGEYRVATPICFEIAFPELVRRATLRSNMILTISNDTWFGDSLGPHQHLSMAQMRALENGKPVIRATNDGITALINHRGQVTHRLPQFISDVLVGETTPHQGATPYSRTGSWPILALAMTCLILCFQRQRRTLL